MRVNEGTRILEVRDDVLQLHQKGKIAIRSRFPIDSTAMLRRVYTPGVAEVCLKIADDPELAWLYTSICHMVAIVTDGSAVLGLGDIGPQASMPVMEGKAMLMETLRAWYAYFAGHKRSRSNYPAIQLSLTFAHPIDDTRAAVSRSRNVYNPCRYSRDARRLAWDGGRQHGS
jgi:hypothetical protein